MIYQKAKRDGVMEMEISAHELEKELKEAFKNGRKEGIKEYSWMKDGVTYIGTTGKTLKQALKEVDDEK